MWRFIVEGLMFLAVGIVITQIILPALIGPRTLDYFWLFKKSKKKPIETIIEEVIEESKVVKMKTENVVHEVEGELGRLNSLKSKLQPEPEEKKQENENL